MMNIDTLIEDLARLKDGRGEFGRGGQIPRLRFHYNYSLPDEEPIELQRLNQVISYSCHHIDKFPSIWDLFISLKEEDKENQYKLFGKPFIDTTRGNIMGTLTPDEMQFRVWNGVPAYISSRHVDSCGQNLIF